MDARFLIEGSKGTILHTGDLRAEPVFLSSLMKNPYVSRFIVPSHTSGPLSERITPTETLDAIFLDTTSMLRTSSIPSKVRAALHSYCFC